VAADPTDAVTRLAYADWLDERGHPGAQYLRMELALSRAAGEEARGLRRRLIDIIPRLPAPWRDRFEQPDLLLAPPVPFGAGWYFEGDAAPRPYRSLPNLDPAMLSPDMPWLTGEDFQERVDQESHEKQERAALAEIGSRAERLGLLLPAGFASFARDFRRRDAVAGVFRRDEVEGRDSFCEMELLVALFGDFQRAVDGYLIEFFADMLADLSELHWALYLVPGIPWHCVVVSQLKEAEHYRWPVDPAHISYCAPSFQAFLYRWWLAKRGQS
jgi:uncharacterized protein (TIGR02996 family)